MKDGMRISKGYFAAAAILLSLWMLIQRLVFRGAVGQRRRSTQKNEESNLCQVHSSESHMKQCQSINHQKFLLLKSHKGHLEEHGTARPAEQKNGFSSRTIA
jgi:hypothetical protein